MPVIFIYIVWIHRHQNSTYPVNPLLLIVVFWSTVASFAGQLSSTQDTICTPLIKVSGLVSYTILYIHICLHSFVVVFIFCR